jgi:hypothetical protein
VAQNAPIKQNVSMAFPNSSPLQTTLGTIGMKHAQSKETKLSPRQSHGTKVLKRAVKELGSRAIDRRTTVGKTLAQWRGDLIQDLGGSEKTSTQERAIIDLAVKTKLIVDSIDAYLVKQPSLVNHRKRALLPVVVQRQQLADALAKYMTQLGLERRAKQLPSLTDYLEKTAPMQAVQTKQADEIPSAPGGELFASKVE